MHSDNETQFGAREILALCEDLRIRNNFSTPNYPQSNGQTERFNKTILENLKKRLERAKERWVEELPNVLWAYRITKRKSTGEIPFFLVYGVGAIILIEV